MWNLDFSVYIQAQTGVGVLQIVEETKDIKKPAFVNSHTKTAKSVVSLSCQRHLSQKAPVPYHTIKIVRNKFMFLKRFLQ